MDSIRELPKPQPLVVRFTWGLFLFHALVWVAFGMIYLLPLAKLSHILRSENPIIGLLMFANAGGYLFLCLGLRKQKRSFYYFAVGYLAVNILLTFADQFGVYDFLYLLLVMLPLAILIWTRGYYSNR